MDPDLKPTLMVELRDQVVTLMLTCSDHYAAIELYEQLVASARDAGMVKLEVRGCRPRRHGGMEVG